MPNHTEAEKTRIRELTKSYLPTNFAQKEARRDCPFASLHHHQASYGQTNFGNIGIIFEFCRAGTPCKFDNTPLPLQMSAERRADLLSELETLDPPPYKDPANTALCRSIRDRILLTGDVTAACVRELPATPTRVRLSHLGLQSLARSGGPSHVASVAPPPATSTGPTRATERSTPSTTSASKGPGRPRRVEVEVTVYGYLRNGELVTTAKAIGYLTQRKQVEFKFFQDAVAEAFGFTNYSRPRFDMYLPHVDQWTDRVIPHILVRGQPILVRRDGVRQMPGFDDLKRLLNPPFDPNGVRPLSTFLDYVMGFPCSGSSASRTPSEPSRTLADIFGSPPSTSSDPEASTPSRKRKSEQGGTPLSRKALKSSSTNDVTGPRKNKGMGAREVIEISDSEDGIPSGSAKGKADRDEIVTSGKGKGKARAPSSEDIIDLTEYANSVTILANASPPRPDVATTSLPQHPPFFYSLAPRPQRVSTRLPLHRASSSACPNTYCISTMAVISPRGAILDSDTDTDHTPVDTSTSNRATASATERRPSISRADRADSDSSASDSEPVVVKSKRGRKPKPKLPSTLAAVDTDNGKHKRFSWSNYRTQEAFLEKELDYILAADSKERRQKKKNLKKKFLDKFGPLEGYTTKEFESILNNWLKNRLQFPNLRKVHPTVVSQAADATRDESPSAGVIDQSRPSVTSTSNPESIALAPLLQSIRRRARGPSGWWAIENAEDVKKLQAKLGGGIGAYKVAVNKLYGALTDEEKAVWEEKADEEKDKISQDETQCFKNQADFPLLVANLIGSFFGYQPDQVGSALAHFRMAIRNETGGIDHVQFTIGLPDDADSFDMYVGGPRQDEIDRWDSFVDDYLPMNPIRRDQRLRYEADGLPKLPPYNEEWSVAEARSALDAWFQAMWHYAHEHGVDVPRGLDWSNFQTSVAPHVPDRWRGGITGKPSDRPFHHLLTLYHNLFEAQDTANAFRWLSSTSSTATEPLPANRAPPKTPSKVVRTTYTTPTKTPAPTRDQSRASSRFPAALTIPSPRPIPPLIFPSLDTIPDDDDTVVPPSARSLTPDIAVDDVAVDDDDRERGSATVEAGSPVNAASDGGVAVHADSNPEAGTELAVRDAAGAATCEHVGETTINEGLTHDAHDAVKGEDARDVAVADSDSQGAIPGDGNEQHDDANAQPDPAAGGHDADTDTAIRRSKRKRQERPSQSTAKRAKASAGEKVPESVSATSHRSARRKQAPPISPVKTRSRAHRDAVANTRQTRARKGSKA